MPTPNALVTEIEALSRTFAAGIIDAMKRASLADILGASGSQGATKGTNTVPTPVKRGPGRPKKDPLADALRCGGRGGTALRAAPVRAQGARGVPRLWPPLPGFRAREVRGLPRAARRGLRVQGSRLLPFVSGQADGIDGGKPRGVRAASEPHFGRRFRPERTLAVAVCP
jgi:hypothetical protein